MKRRLSFVAVVLATWIWVMAQAWAETSEVESVKDTSGLHAPKESVPDLESSDDAAPAKPGKKGAKKKHVAGSKNIEFEEGYVEGVMKSPADYSTKMTKWKDRKEHLYKKEINFEHEMQETLRETRYSQ